MDGEYNAWQEEVGALVLCHHAVHDHRTLQEFGRDDGGIRREQLIPKQDVILGFLPMANPKYAVSDKAMPVAELVDTLSDGTKVKRRAPRMRACNEKDDKGKLCAGHLKRWYFFGDEVKQKYGTNAEVYRCEHCKTLYLPNPEEEPRTGTLSF